MKHKTILFIIMLLQLIFLKAAEHSQKDCMVLANQMNNINVTLDEIKQSIQACECCKSIFFFVLCHFIAKWGCILCTEKQLDTFCIENAIDLGKEFSKINHEEIVSLNRKFMPKETLLWQALKSLSKNHLKNNYMKKIKKRIKKLLNLGANPSSLLSELNKKWCLVLNKIKLQEIFFQLLIHAYLHHEAALFKTIEPYEYLVDAYVKYKEYKKQLPAVLYYTLTKQNGFSYDMPAELVNMISEY